MLDYHYNYIKPKYGDKVKLLFTDTDSFCYLIMTDDFYQEMRREEYDLSDYPEDNPFYSTANKIDEQVAALKAQLAAYENSQLILPNKDLTIVTS